MMTGESVPGEAAEGDSVIGGTVALTGRLVVRAVRTGPDTQLSHLIRLVEHAQAEKAGIQRIADRICGVFVPAVLGCAAAHARRLAAGRVLRRARGQRRARGADHRLPVRAGPGDPGGAGGGPAAAAPARDILKGYQALESSRSVTCRGPGQDRDRHHRADVAGRRAPRREREPRRLLRYAGAVEQASEHAVAAAITAAARTEAAPLPQAAGFRALPGLGARGTVDGREVLVGRERLLADHGLSVPAEPGPADAGSGEAGRTAVLAGWDGAARGAIAVADTVKPSAAPASPNCARSGCAPSC